MEWMEVWLIYKRRLRLSDKKVGCGLSEREKLAWVRGRSTLGDPGGLLPAAWSSVTCLGLPGCPSYHRWLYHQVLTEAPQVLRLVQGVEHLESMRLLQKNMTF